MTSPLTFLTVQQGIDRISRQYDRTIGEIDNDLWLDFFNELNQLCYRSLVSVNAQRYVVSTTLPLITDIAEYNVPSDFKHIRANANIGAETGLYEQDTNGDSILPGLIQTGYGRKDPGYFFQNDQIVITPTPTAIRILNFRYIPAVDILTLTSNFLVINNEHLSMVMNYLDKEYGQWNLDIFKENNADQRFTRAFNSFIQDDRSNHLIFTL